MTRGLGLILFPTKGRPLSLKRFVTHYYLTGATEKVCLIFEKANAPYYESVGWPDHWIVREFEGGQGACSHHNKVFAEFPNELYYASLADDVVPETPYWDLALKAACLPDKVATGDEGIDRTEQKGIQYFPCHAFIGGDLVRRWGFITPPPLVHCFADDWWYAAAGELVVLKQVKLTHRTWKNGEAERDDTYRGKRKASLDRPVYDAFVKSHQHLIPHPPKVTVLG